jgi:hypothetical protein
VPGDCEHVINLWKLLDDVSTLKDHAKWSSFIRTLLFSLPISWLVESDHSPLGLYVSQSVLSVFVLSQLPKTFDLFLRISFIPTL